MKPKLLVLTSTFPRWEGDADPPFVYNLSKRLTEQFDVTIHAPHFPGAETREIVDGMKVHRFRYSVPPFEKLAGATGILPTLRTDKLYYILVPFLLIAQFFSLVFLVRKLRPDVIHAHWLIPQGVSAIFLKIIFNIPVVVTAHGADVFGLQGKFLKIIKRMVSFRADKVTVVSDALKKKLSEILAPNNHSSLIILPMGVDSAMFSPNKKNLSIKEKYRIENHLLLYVGRLTEKKGVRYLIDAMPLILHQCPHIKLLIVGNGELGSELQNQVKSQKLDKKVYFIGRLSNTELPAYYATSDIFIGPSIRADGGDTEGFGLTFVEASMSGCLVIGTDTGGIKDIIKDNETGFLVPQKDSEALARRIIYSLEHKDEVKRISRNGRKRCIENYDWKIIADRYANLFFQVMGENPESYLEK
jgi:glycosyltransferase involved in cell wall biosynthesis